MLEIVGPALEQMIVFDILALPPNGMMGIGRTKPAARVGIATVPGTREAQVVDAQ